MCIKYGWVFVPKNVIRNMFSKAARKLIGAQNVLIFVVKIPTTYEWAGQRPHFDDFVSLRIEELFTIREDIADIDFIFSLHNCTTAVTVTYDIDHVGEPPRSGNLSLSQKSVKWLAPSSIPGA